MSKFQWIKLGKDAIIVEKLYRKCTRAETVGYAGLNVIDNLELDL